MFALRLLRRRRLRIKQEVRWTVRRAAAITLHVATFALFLGTVSVTTPVLAVIHDDSASISRPSVTSAPTDLPADGTPLGTQPFTDHRNPPPYRKLSEAEFARYDLGMAVFNTHFVPAGTPNAGRRAGVGPLFNSSSCDSCHNNGAHGRGPTEDGPAPSALVIQLATTPTKNPTDPEGDPVYGRVFNTIALDGVPPEGVAMIRYQETPGHYPDGSAWSLRVPHYTFTNLRYGPLSPRTLIKPRLAPALFGVGLLDAAGRDAAAFDRVADVAAGKGVRMHQRVEPGDFLGDIVLGAAGQVQNADAPAAVRREQVAHDGVNPDNVFLFIAAN